MADARRIEAATPKELEIVQYMTGFRNGVERAVGVAMNASLSELAEHFGVRTSTIHEHLSSMCDKQILVEVANPGHARRYEPNLALQTSIAQRQLAETEAAQ